MAEVLNIKVTMFCLVKYQLKNILWKAVDKMEKSSPYNLGYHSTLLSTSNFATQGLNQDLSQQPSILSVHNHFPEFE